MEPELKLLESVLAKNKVNIHDYNRVDVVYTSPTLPFKNKPINIDKFFEVTLSDTRHNTKIIVTVLPNYLKSGTNKYTLNARKFEEDYCKFISQIWKNNLSIKDIIPMLKQAPSLLDEKERDTKKEERVLKDFFLNQLED